jgi:type I restriction enzyme S subunit
MKKILTKGDFEKITMIKPPFEIQNRFAVIVEKVEGIKSRYQQSLTYLETLYGALSQQAFKGELDLSRVPLPIIKPDEEKTVATKPLQAFAKQGNAINLPDTDNLLDALESAEARAALIMEWLEAYRGQLGSTPFSAQRFMAAAQTRLAELHPDNDFALGANDYEHIKTWLFEALADGRLQQSRDITGHDKSGAPIIGNQIEIKSGARP